MTLFYLILGILFLLVFATPVRIGATGTLTDEETGFRGWVRLLLGAIGVDLTYDGALRWHLTLGPVRVLHRTIGGSEEEKPPESREANEKKPEKEKEAKSLSEQLALARAYYDRFKAPVVTLLKRASKTVWFRRFHIEGVAGAGSPESTGKLTGLIYAAESHLGRRVQLAVTPDFLGSGFKGKIQFEVWFWPGFLIIVVLLAAIGIGIRFVVWYLQENGARLWQSILARFRRPKAQTA